MPPGLKRRIVVILSDAAPVSKGNKEAAALMQTVKTAAEAFDRYISAKSAGMLDCLSKVEA